MEDEQNENTENEKDIVVSAKKLSIDSENSTNSTDDTSSTSDSNLLINSNPSSVDSCEVLSNFAVTWDQYRDVNQCSCGKAMENLSRKVCSSYFFQNVFLTYNVSVQPSIYFLDIC